MIVSTILLRVMLWMFPALETATHPPAAAIPLDNAYAHNDYWHKRPLFDALEKGYTSIEVDIFKIRNEFVVAHMLPVFRPGKTLENLYLRPLKEYINAHGGYVYPGYRRPITLMIDIKFNGNGTYRALKGLLQKYRDILTEYNGGIVTEKQVTIVLSGSKPYHALRAEENRLAFIDEDLAGIIKNPEPSSVCPIASCHYRSLLNWDGKNTMPEIQRLRLESFVIAAHRQGKKVRLWASPESANVWRQLLHCGVDLINTDRLADLQDFLLARANDERKLLAASR